MKDIAKTYLSVLPEHRQIKHRLVLDDDAYCCLGVMCKVLGYETVDNTFVIDGASYCQMPPPKIYEELGFYPDIQGNAPMLRVDMNHPELATKAPIFYNVHGNIPYYKYDFDIADDLNDKEIPFTEIAWLLRTFGEWRNE